MLRLTLRSGLNSRLPCLDRSWLSSCFINCIDFIGGIFHRIGGCRMPDSIGMATILLSFWLRLGRGGLGIRDRLSSLLGF